MSTSIFSCILLCHPPQLQNKRGHFWLQLTVKRPWEGTAEKIQHSRHFLYGVRAEKGNSLTTPGCYLNC